MNTYIYIYTYVRMVWLYMQETPNDGLRKD